MSEPQMDEALKGAADVARSQAHFSILAGEDYDTFRKSLEEDFFTPGEALKNKAVMDKCLAFLRSNDFQVQIPMWNEADTVGPIVKFLVMQLDGPERVICMDANSDDNSVEVVESYGVRAVRQADMYACVKWDKFCELLNDPKPRGRGMTLYAMQIYRFLIQDGHFPRYLCYSDSDIRNFAEYDPLPHLAYPIVNEPDTHWLYAKIAKPGRNNEPVMAARCAAQSCGRVGLRFFERLARDMWMISGEYMVEGEHMRRCAHTTRSFVDTMTAVYFADLDVAGKGEVAIVGNANRRLDKKNDNMKEQTILYSIASNIVAFSIYNHFASELTLDDIRHLNTKIFNKLEIYPYIPEASEPMCAVKIMNDRFIPSIEQLIAADLVDTARVAEMRKKYGSRPSA
jgi:glycosyltransferase involved in cell wall biosynthesis